MERIDKQGWVKADEHQLRQQFLAALAGDMVVYQQVLKTLAGHLRAFFRGRLFGLPEDVEDLVQETLLAIHNHRHTYDAEQPLTAWVYAIARYRLVDLLRARGRREALHDPLNEEEALFTSSDTEDAQARRDLGRLLAHLPDRFRRPIECMKLEGLSVAETARVTGMSESAVKTGVHRGMKALTQLVRSTK